jgi:hypothetical protein
MKHHRGDQDPSPADLAAIEAEWPAIEAELALVDVEIRMLTVDRPSLLDWRRLRRAERRVLAVHARIYGTGGLPGPAGPEVA